MSFENSPTFAPSAGDNATTPSTPGRVRDHLMHMHLILKFYFAPIEQQHVIYLLNLYRGNGNLNYLCLHLSSLVDTVMKQCLLRSLIPFVPKQHLRHYYKLVADLYNGLNLDHVPVMHLGHLKQMQETLKEDHRDHFLLDLQRALGISDDQLSVQAHETDSNANGNLRKATYLGSKSNLTIGSQLQHSTINNNSLCLPASTQLKESGSLCDRMSLDEVDAGLRTDNASRMSNMSGERVKEEDFTVEVKRKFNQAYGFRIKGGCEVSEPIVISEVSAGSQAEKAGLKVGDRIVRVNEQSFEPISIKEASKLIRSNKKLKLKIIRRLPAPTFPGTTNRGHFQGQLSKDKEPIRLPENIGIEEAACSPDDLIWVNAFGRQIKHPDEHFLKSPIVKVRKQFVLLMTLVVVLSVQYFPVVTMSFVYLRLWILVTGRRVPTFDLFQGCILCCPQRIVRWASESEEDPSTASGYSCLSWNHTQLHFATDYRWEMRSWL